jgi:hypothetical protein
METNELLREQIFEIIQNQMRDNNPPEINLTYALLISLGYDEFGTKQLIGQCVVEIYNVLKHKKPFDEIKF